MGEEHAKPTIVHLEFYGAHLLLFPSPASRSPSPEARESVGHRELLRDMPPAAPRLTPEPGIIVDAPKSVAGKFSDDDKLIFWNRHGDDTANGPLYAMGAVKAGFPDEAKALAEAVKALNPMDPVASGQWMDGWSDKERRLPQ